MKVFLLDENRTQLGDEIDDNEYKDNGYRFHDVIHIALMVHFRWSPYLRGKDQLNIKRKAPGDEEFETVEDGAKAGDLEEAFCLLIFSYLEEHKFLESNGKIIPEISSSFLRNLRSLSKDREISQITEGQWNILISESARIIRELLKYKKGFIIADNSAGTLTFKKTLEK